MQPKASQEGFKRLKEFQNFPQNFLPLPFQNIQPGFEAPTMPVNTQTL